MLGTTKCPLCLPLNITSVWIYRRQTSWYINFTNCFPSVLTSLVNVSSCLISCPDLPQKRKSFALQNRVRFGYKINSCYNSHPPPPRKRKEKRVDIVVSPNSKQLTVFFRYLLLHLSKGRGHWVSCLRSKPMDDFKKSRILTFTSEGRRPNHYSTTPLYNSTTQPQFRIVWILNRISCFLFCSSNLCSRKCYRLQHQCTQYKGWVD